ncbi:hypothetical protein EUGRSUZ_D00701 [Eucalyptus grandis]|uniref:Uncharacterized protein n=1 Tax=Eucalyptus grandis TaxID=71139 RepID=A0A059CDJ1_EUCGR|nr:hypothetical protein EUGRSUZ_D00701 [Eucalyptus grandis]
MATHSNDSGHVQASGDGLLRQLVNKFYKIRLFVFLILITSKSDTVVICNDPMSYSALLEFYAWPTTNKEKDFRMHVVV